MPITAAYARYSSDRQRAASIPDQLRGTRARCASEGWPEPIVYADEKISGGRIDRPEYQRLMADVDAGRLDILLVDEFTRLGRDLGESWQAIKRCKFRSVRVIGVVDGTDTDRRGYKLETGFRGLIGEHYLDDLAEKTHRGLTGLALDGYSAGGLPYGYRSIETPDGHRREIDPSQAQWIRYIYERAVNGLSPRRIARELNERGIPSPRNSTWASSAIYGDRKRGIGILGNPVYIGKQIWNRSKWLRDPETGRRRRIERPESEWIITEHPELRIIDDELWNAIHQRRQKHPRRGPRSKYLFSGLLRCGECDGAYVIIDRYRYGCAAHKDRGTCSNAIAVPRKIVEARLLAAVQNELLADDCFRQFERAAHQALRAARPDPSAARQALRSAEQERENILRALRAGIITESTKRELERAETQVSEAKSELRKIENFEPSQILPRARETYKRLVGDLAEIDDVHAARTALTELLGEEIKLIPEDGGLVAELQNQMCQIFMVAGAGYEQYLTAPVRVSLLP